MKEKLLKFWNLFMKYKYITLPFMISLFFAILGYYFQPVEGYDLYAYNLWMDKMLTFNKKDLTDFIFYRGEFLVMSYFYAIALIGNYGLTQFFPTFIFYFIMLYMIFDYAKMKKISDNRTIFVCLIFLSLFKFVFAVSSFRYVLAYALFAFGIYLEFIKGKKNVLYKLLYIIPMFIHTSSFILLFLRLFLVIKNNKIIYMILFTFCLVMFFPKSIIFYIDLFKDVDFLVFIGERVKLYLIQEQVPITLQNVFRTGQTFLLATSGFVCYYIFNKKIRKKQYKHEQYYMFYLVVAIFTLSQISHYSIYMRFIDMVLFLSPVVIFNLLEGISKKKKELKWIVYALIILFIIGGIRIQIPIFEQMYFLKVVI